MNYSKIRKLRQGLAEQTIPYLPEKLRSKLTAPEYTWSAKDLRTLARAEDSPTRLLIAPANYASQGYFWAQAARTIPGVYATNMRFLRPGLVPTTPSHVDLPGNVGSFSQVWARRQRDLIHDQFTHVLIESGRSILGPLYAGDLRREVEGYLNAGIKVGFIHHGTDIRHPDIHKSYEPNSPFHGELKGFTATARQQVERNYKVLDDLNLPEFVSTPDLLRFRPKALWLPVLTNPRPWLALDPPPFDTKKLSVLHVPSRQPALKGSEDIRRSMDRLEREGLIKYSEATFVPYPKMPERMRRADVVINQINMGLYAAVGVEAMYAGRLVVSQVWDSVRREIRRETGWELPVVEANATTVYSVVKEIAATPENYAGKAAEGRDYAKDVHSDSRAAEVLKPFLSR